MKRCIAILTVLVTTMLCAGQTAPGSEKPSTAEGQQRGEGRGETRGFRGPGGGTIGEISKDGFTLKQQDGKTITVKVKPDTQFRRDRQEAKFSDFKPGDMVMVAGEPAGENTWTARFVVSRQGMSEANMQVTREDLGKKFIAGEVKAIDGTRLTIARPDGQTQTIEVDENTSFRKGRESITLPDIKAGDRIFGRGALNSAGVFVPTELNVGGMMFRGPGGGGGGERTQAPPPK
ncbi:MAG TPA: DUF5666 domain-containing protein [Terriglobales bacterium]|jgi:hypothetical protein|nr:DUF5666 domain-containing protein [Terriglobales bacterium]